MFFISISVCWHLYQYRSKGWNITYATTTSIVTLVLRHVRHALHPTHIAIAVSAEPYAKARRSIGRLPSWYLGHLRCRRLNRTSVGQVWLAILINSWSWGC